MATAIGITASTYGNHFLQTIEHLFYAGSAVETWLPGADPTKVENLATSKEGVRTPLGFLFYLEETGVVDPQEDLC